MPIVMKGDRRRASHRRMRAGQAQAARRGRAAPPASAIEHGPDPPDRLAYILAIERDIREQAQTAVAVRTSEAQLRAFFDGAQAVHYLIDRDYRILAFNRVAAETTRQLLQRELAVGDLILTYVAPANRDAFIEHIQLALRGEASHYERLVNIGAATIWYDVTYHPVQDADGSILGVAFTALDVTARKHTEASLRLRDRAISAAGTGIVIVDAGQPDLPLIYVNPACERITGYSAAELIGHNCRILAGPGADPAIRAQIREAIAAGRGCHVTIQNRRKDGSQFSNELQISPVTDDLGQVTHFIGVQTDVTERLVLEAKLYHAQKMDTIGRLAGGIAHDFNNLLTVISGASSFARALVPVDHPVQLELAEISRASERAAELTRKLLATARKQSIEPVPLDLNDLIIDVERMLRRLIGAQIEICIDLDHALAPVLADAAQIEQVLVNLAVNARDAMPAGGVLVISTRNERIPAGDATAPAQPASDRVIVEVRDTGVGMTPEIQAHIFEPFFTTKDPGLGTGLGLPTCYGIVKQHRGDITCESSPGHGTCFRVALPADSTPTARPADTDA